MKALNNKQVCFKCKQHKPVDDFYEKGNRFMNCSECRKDRYHRKKSLEVLLNKEKEENRCL